MNCKKVLAIIPSISPSLEDIDFKDVRTHLESCPSCQTSYSKTQKLRSLLALKRHEKPDEFFVRTFTSEVHRRVCSEMIQRPSLWTRLRQAFTWESRPVSIFAYSTVFGAIVLSLCTVHLVTRNSNSHSLARSTSPSVMGGEAYSVVEVESRVTQLIEAEQSASGSAVYVLDRVQYDSSHGPALLHF
jgi:hypothetical protein